MKKQNSLNDSISELIKNQRIETVKLILIRFGQVLNHAEKNDLDSKEIRELMRSEIELIKRDLIEASND